MKIWIRTEALNGKQEDLLWPGALFGISYLKKMGHEVGFTTDMLTDRRRILLENEGITSDFDAPDTADFSIVSNDGSVLTVDPSGDSIPVVSGWAELSDKICFPDRTARYNRTTTETDINIELNIDGTGRAKVDTGIGFLDHMLEQIAKHGLVDLGLSCKGDLEVDEHHTIEDTAIALGETILKALGPKMGIQRYSFLLPMDESSARVALDLSGRPYLKFDAEFSREKVGEFPTEMTEHFFYSLAMNLKATLHIAVEGENDHHKIEACFKGFARCLRASVSRSERLMNILPSTKDML